MNTTPVVNTPVATEVSTTNTTNTPAKPAWGDFNKPVEASSIKSEATKIDTNTKPVEVKPDVNTGERKFKVKVDGQELEVTEKELVSGYSLNKAATQKMQEAAATRKQAEQFIELLRTNPMKVLSNPNLGIDAKKFAEEYLLQVYEDQIDPKSAENRKLKAQLEEIENAKKEREESERQAKVEQETQHWMNHYVQDIDGAIANSTSLPKNNKAVYERVLHYMLLGHQEAYIQRNGRAATAKDVLPLVENEFKEMTKSLYKDASAEQLMEYFGDEIAGKLRKADVARLKNPIQAPKTTPKTKFTKDTKQKPMGLYDFREALKEMDRQGR